MDEHRDFHHDFNHGQHDLRPPSSQREIPDIFMAARSGNYQLLKQMVKLQSTIDPHDGSGNTPLHLACQHGHFDCAELLVSSQADLQARNTTSCTPLILAVMNAERQEKNRPEKKQPHFKVAELLLASGAKPNEHDAWGQTPLHEAAKRNDVAMMKLLMEHGAKANERDESRRTPLHVAAWEGHAEAVRLLLTNGAERHPLDMVCHGRVLSRVWCFHVRIPLGACSAQQERSPANLARLRSHSLVMELLPELAIALPTAPAEPSPGNTRAAALHALRRVSMLNAPQ